MTKSFPYGCLPQLHPTNVPPYSDSNFQSPRCKKEFELEAKQYFFVSYKNGDVCHYLLLCIYYYIKCLSDLESWNKTYLSEYYLLRIPWETIRKVFSKVTNVFLLPLETNALHYLLPTTSSRISSVWSLPRRLESIWHFKRAVRRCSFFSLHNVQIQVVNILLICELFGSLTFPKNNNINMCC